VALIYAPPFVTVADCARNVCMAAWSLQINLGFCVYLFCLSAQDTVPAHMIPG